MLPRIMPLVLVENGRAVHTIRFGRGEYLGDPLNMSRLYSGFGADELIILDRSTFVAQTLLARGGLGRIARASSSPVAYGGGLKSTSEVARAFKAGVDKIVVQSEKPNSAALVAWASSEYGSQAVVVCINYGPRNKLLGPHYVSSIEGVRERAISFSKLGAGEIMVQSVLRSGMRTGLDAEGLLDVKRAVSIPLVLSGGAGSYSDVDSAFKFGYAGVAISTLFSRDAKSRAPLVSYVSDEEKLRLGWL